MMNYIFMNPNVLNYILFKASNKLKIGSYSRFGKNFSGRICVFHRGGGFVRKYRLLDIHRRLNLNGVIYNVIYDPNRTAFIGLVLYENGLLSYIILSHSLTVGSKVFSGEVVANDIPVYDGSSVSLKYINLFTIVNNIELRERQGASLCRAAGTSAIIISKTEKSAILKLKSGWHLTIPLECIASLGYCSNMEHNMVRIGKAGKVRGLGIRPTTRGVAMNPCDHPHGGGNGKTSPPSSPMSPWGKLTKGTHTKRKKTDKLKRFLFKKIR